MTMRLIQGLTLVETTELGLQATLRLIVFSPRTTEEGPRYPEGLFQKARPVQNPVLNGTRLLVPFDESSNGINRGAGFSGFGA